MTIAEASRKYGLSADALRYYVNTCVPKWRYGEE